MFEIHDTVCRAGCGASPFFSPLIEKILAKHAPALEKLKEDLKALDGSVITVGGKKYEYKMRKGWFLIHGNDRKSAKR